MIALVAGRTPAPGADRTAATRPDGDGVSLAELQHPESVVFLLYRRLSFMPSGEVSGRLRRQIAGYQARAHDRQRRVGPKWVGPADFTRARQAFLADLAEARQIYDKMTRRRRATAEQLRANERLRAQAAVKLDVAAKRWPDPLLRKFLLGAAALQTPDYGRAHKMFRSCIKIAPRVAGFWQGLGMALAGNEKYAEALGAFNQVLRLKPDSPYALSLVRRAMSRVPGAQIRRQEYLDAVELVKKYAGRARRQNRLRGISWLMPGGTWRVREGLGLPRPAYDRLAFKQAVGVPVAERALLVDAAAVRDAAEVFVRAGDGRLIPAKVKKARRTSGTGAKLALVVVEGYRFEPLAVGSGQSLAAGRQVKAFGLNIFEEMGTTVRTFSAELVALPDGAGLGLSKALAAGEAAGPVVTPDGRLVGVLTGKTDPQSDGGGPDRFAGTDELADILRQARRTRPSAAGRQGEDAPINIKGDHFTVLATCGERITKDTGSEGLARSSSGR